MKKIVLGLVALVSIVSANAQETKLGLKLNKGDKYTFTSKSAVKNVTEMGGQEMKATVDATTFQEVEVTDFANGNYTLSVMNSGYEMKANSPMQGGDVELSTNTGKGFDQFPNGMPGFLKNAANVKFTMVVNEAGQLVSSTGLEKLQKVDMDQMGMIKMMLGGIDLNVTDSLILKYTLSFFDYNKKGSIKAGESWSVESGSKKEPFTKTYKATGASAATLNIETTSTGKINSSMNIMGQEAEVSGTTSSTGKVDVDIKTGVVSSEVLNNKAKVTISAGGMEIPTTNDTVVTNTATKK